MDKEWKWNEFHFFSSFHSFSPWYIFLSKKEKGSMKNAVGGHGGTTKGDWYQGELLELERSWNLKEINDCFQKRRGKVEKHDSRYPLKFDLEMKKIPFHLQQLSIRSHSIMWRLPTILSPFLPCLITRNVWRSCLSYLVSLSFLCICTRTSTILIQDDYPWLRFLPQSAIHETHVSPPLRLTKKKNLPSVNIPQDKAKNTNALQ